MPEFGDTALMPSNLVMMSAMSFAMTFLHPNGHSVTHFEAQRALEARLEIAHQLLATHLHVAADEDHAVLSRPIPSFREARGPHLVFRCFQPFSSGFHHLSSILKRISKDLTLDFTKDMRPNHHVDTLHHIFQVAARNLQDCLDSHEVLCRIFTEILVQKLLKCKEVLQPLYSECRRSTPSGPFLAGRRWRTLLGSCPAPLGLFPD